MEENTMEDNKLNPTGVPDEVNNAAQEGADTLAEKVADKVEAIGETAENAGEKVVDTVTDVVEAAGESADEFGDKVVDVVKGTENAAEAAADTAADAAKTEGGSFVDKVAGVVNAAGEAADSFGDKVADTVSETFGGANNGAAEAEKAIQPNAIYTNAGAPVGQPEDSKLFAIISLVCGIVSIVSCCCWGINIIPAAAAIVTGIISKKKNESGSGMALAGIIMGAVAILLGIISLVLSIIKAVADAN